MLQSLYKYWFGTFDKVTQQSIYFDATEFSVRLSASSLNEIKRIYFISITANCGMFAKKSHFSYEMLALFEVSYSCFTVVPIHVAKKGKKLFSF